MSRSRQHTPIAGVTPARSEKSSKRQWNRSYRRAANRSDDPAPDARRNEREGRKDGKLWFGDDNPEAVDRLMRK